MAISYSGKTSSLSNTGGYNPNFGTTPGKNLSSGNQPLSNLPGNIANSIAGAGNVPDISGISNALQGVSGSVSGTVQSGLSKAELTGPPLQALNALSNTGLPSDISGFTEAAKLEGAQTYQDLRNQIMQDMAATGGLDSSARVGRLADAAQRVSTNIGIEGLRSKFAASEAAANRRLGVLTPAVNALGIKASALGTLGGLQNEATGNRIKALGSAGSLLNENYGLKQAGQMGQIDRGQNLYNSLIGSGGSKNVGGGAFGISKSPSHLPNSYGYKAPGYGPPKPMAYNPPAQWNSNFFTAGDFTGAIPRALSTGMYVSGPGGYGAGMPGNPNQSSNAQFSSKAGDPDYLAPGFRWENGGRVLGFVEGGRAPQHYQGAAFLDWLNQVFGVPLPSYYGQQAPAPDPYGGVMPGYNAYDNSGAPVPLDEYGYPSPDTVPAMLSPGETVIDQPTSDAIATGSMPESEIVRRIQQFVNTPGGEPIEQWATPPPGAIPDLNLPSFNQTVGPGGVPNYELTGGGPGTGYAVPRPTRGSYSEMGGEVLYNGQPLRSLDDADWLQKRSDLLRMAIATGPRGPAERLKEELAKNDAALKTALETRNEYEKILSEKTLAELEMNRRAELDAATVRDSEEGRRQGRERVENEKRGLELEEERLDQMRDPVKDAMRMLLTNEGTPQELERARQLVDKRFRLTAQNGQQRVLVSSAMSIIGNRNLPFESKLAALEGLGISIREAQEGINYGIPFVDQPEKIVPDFSPGQAEPDALQDPIDAMFEDYIFRTLREE